MRRVRSSRVTVKNITSYGVFVDLGGVDGLVHITDLSWGRVSDPHEVVALDQKINVVILDFDEEKSVSLSVSSSSLSTLGILWILTSRLRPR